MPRQIRWLTTVLVVALVMAAPASAAVDLVTLPTREGTQLTIYNSEDITMVREHRLLTVKPGVNRIQFSWANTLIDPTSIDFRILDQQDKVDLVDTTFPAGRNDALQWNIQSQMAGKIAGRDPLLHQRHHLVGRLRGHRQRGRDEAQPDRLRPRDEQLGRTVRQRPDAAGGGHDQPGGEDRRLGEEAAAGAMDRELTRHGDASQVRLATEPQNEAAKMSTTHERRRRQRADGARSRKQVVKQGLSEYFLFTIEGREDISDKEPKRLVALKVAEVPLECFYKLTDRDGGTVLHQVLPLQEPQAARRAGQGEEALGDGEPGPLAAARRQRAAVLRVPDQGPGLRRRHARPSTCPSATASRSTSAATRTSRSPAG